MGSNGSRGGQGALAAMLVEAHRTGERIRQCPPDLVPQDIAAALAVQNEVARALGEDAGGWKVSLAPDGPVGAPMFASGLVGEGARRRLGQGFCGIEVEFAVRLKRDVMLPAGTVPARQDILAAVDRLLIGIEIIESRLEDHLGQPFNAFLADNLANGGYVVGREIPFDPTADLTGRHCRVEIAGAVAFDETAAHGNGDPLVPLIACASLTGGAMGPWRAGSIVTTGSVCGVLPVSGPGLVTASLEGIGICSVELT